MDVEIDGNIGALTLDISVDLCGTVGAAGYNYTDCLSDWSKPPYDLPFPIVLLDEEFDFSGICSSAGVTLTEVDVMKLPNIPVCCSKCTDNCIWSGVQHECTIGC
jgi:hypothetical protein